MLRRCLVALVAALACAPGNSARADGAVDFDNGVRPLLSRRCSGCHNAQDTNGGLDLTQRETARAGGDSGAALQPGSPEASLLWQRIAAGEMPPKQKLSAAEQELLRAWIATGAPWSGGPLDPFEFTSDTRAGYDWWSLQPLRVQTPPAAPVGDPLSAIDAFVQRKLADAKRHPSPLADRRTLIRRLYFDLLGLPPDPALVAEFVCDPSPSAYDALVDRLLTSPAYGQRWARHWLDVARFGESQGFERDRLRTNLWRYRDWVIDALNNDLPYDEFARRQLAGDVLHPGDREALIATGFLVAGAYDEVGQKQQSGAMRAVVRQDELEDLVSTVAQTFLGLTVNCSRCHDHKFDPIRQVEYYGLAATLAGVHHGEPTLPAGDRRASPSMARISARRRAISAQLAHIEQPWLDAGFGEMELAAILGEDRWQERTQLRFELDHLKQQQQSAADAKVYAVVPAPPETTYVLDRGNPAAAKGAVTPGGIAALRGVRADFGLDGAADDAQRRRCLADWIASPGNPLFARVMVNRLWQHHFGVGLVETPNDFGFNGGRPSHPELLDWLAAELIRNDWSLKRLHRLIVTSQTYRQSSRLDERAATLDADNRLLWRKSPQRLDAETLRDTLLELAGLLDSSLEGPGFHEFTTYVHNSQFYDMRDAVGVTFNRRTIYRTWVRSARSQLLDVFDCPDPSTNTPHRAVTTTPLQALSLLNNSFVLRMADAFAARVEAEAGELPGLQVRQVFLRALARTPEQSEQTACEQLVREHGLAALCRVVFNSNELLYVD